MAVPLDTLEELTILLRDLNEHPSSSNDMIVNALHLVEPFYFNPLKPILDEVFAGANRTAQDLSKPAPVINLDLKNFAVNPKAEETLKNIFVHLMRNSLAHGIELPKVRKEYNKTDEGHIFVEANQLRLGDDLWLEILHFDDGQGLNLHAIKDKLKAAGHHDCDTWPIAKVANHIFTSGVSTAKEVSDISGRGVGMDAIKNFIETAGGRLELMISDKQVRADYCQFKIRILLPANMYTQRIGEQVFELAS